MDPDADTITLATLISIAEEMLSEGTDEDTPIYVIANGNIQPANVMWRAPSGEYVYLEHEAAEL